MRNLLAALRRELLARRPAVLCTVVAHSGSAPRGAGAALLVLQNGDTIGTVGGGAVEQLAVQQARTACLLQRSQFVSYQLAPGGPAKENTTATDMVCGGSLRIFFQFISPTVDGLLPVLDAAAALLSSGTPGWLVTAINSDGTWHLGLFDRQAELRFLENIPIDRVRSLAGPRTVFDPDTPALLVAPLAPPGTVFLFGGGHVGCALGKILALTDFRLVVCDPRPEAADPQRFPDAADILCAPYKDALQQLSLSADDFAVVMTHGHSADYEVLSQLLRSPARYIGCIGSRKKAAITRQRLLADGFSPTDIDRLHCPIGLPIGGKTPGEIAVSVAAELIACRTSA